MNSPTILKRHAGLTGLLAMILFVPGDLPAHGSHEHEHKAQPNSQAITVGAYYYPWFEKEGGPESLDWMNKNLNTWQKNVMRSRLDRPQLPLVGWYDSADPEIVGAHINQSLRGNIDFWAVSWWGPDSKTDRTLRDVILPHPDAEKLKYAVLYEATGRFGKFDSPDYSNWLKDLAYLKKHYFDHPSYLKVEGRPVLFMYLTREYFRGRGEEALKQLREQFPEVYLIGDDVFCTAGEKNNYHPEWAKQFDAVTAYDIYGQSVGPLGGTQKAVDHLARGYAEVKQVANRAGTAFVPAIAPGYNDVAVREGNPGRARTFSDQPDSKEGDIFRAMIREVALPNLDERCGGMMMITSFNEWYEDTQIEPTKGSREVTNRDDSPNGKHFTGGQNYDDYGYLYLDILSELTGQH